MAKIRIPRKLKKKTLDTSVKMLGRHPYVTKHEKYLNYFSIEYAMKRFDMTAEEVYKTFGWCLKDYVIWWHWVRKKHLGIEPQMSEDFQEYWDYLVENNAKP